MIHVVAGAVLTMGSFSSDEVVSTSASDKWTFLGLFVTAVITPIVLYLINSRTLKPPGTATDPSETVATPHGSSFSVEGMSSNTVEVLLSMWKKIDELEETQEHWATEREEFIRINEELRRHNRALAEGFDDLIDWIDSGAEPPPPSIAQHIRDLVQQSLTSTDDLGAASNS